MRGRGGSNRTVMITALDGPSEEETSLCTEVGIVTSKAVGRDSQCIVLDHFYSTQK